MEPEFIIADEPICVRCIYPSSGSKLNVEITKERGITFLFIAHDLSMVKYISDRIAVMHFGKIVELGSPTKFIIIHYMIIRNHCYRDSST